MKKVTLHLDEPAQRMLTLLCRALNVPARDVVKYSLSCAIVNIRQELEAQGVRPGPTQGDSHAARDGDQTAAPAGESAAVQAAQA